MGELLLKILKGIEPKHFVNLFGLVVAAIAVYGFYLLSTNQIASTNITLAAAIQNESNETQKLVVNYDERQKESNEVLRNFVSAIQANTEVMRALTSAMNRR